MKMLHPLFMIGVSFLALILNGCYFNSRGRNVQELKLRITHSESGQPVTDVKVYLTSERSQQFYGQPLVTNSNGIVEFVVEEYYDCTQEPKRPPDPLCTEVANVDVVTGTQRTILVEGEEQAEFTELVLEVGNTTAGSLFTLEVIEITEPVFEIIYAGL